jgi:hypothetical protein
MLETNGRAQSATPADVGCWISTEKEGSPNGTGAKEEGKDKDWRPQ